MWEKCTIPALRYWTSQKLSINSQKLSFNQFQLYKYRHERAWKTDKENLYSIQEWENGKVILCEKAF